MNRRKFGLLVVGLLLFAGLVGGFNHARQSGWLRADQEVASPTEALPWDLNLTGPSPESINAQALPHDRPPDLEALSTSNTQAAYDAAAQPGEFVTPPAISLPH